RMPWRTLLLRDRAARCPSGPRPSSGQLGDTPGLDLGDATLHLIQEQIAGRQRPDGAGTGEQTALPIRQSRRDRRGGCARRAVARADAAAAPGVIATGASRSLAR